MRSQKINRLLPIYISILPLKFGVDIQGKTKVSLETKKIQYGHQAAILKVTLLKINRLLPMTTINMHMKFEIEIPKQTSLRLWKFGVDIQSQTKVVWKPKNPIWPPGGHFESDVAENQ